MVQPGVWSSRCAPNADDQRRRSRTGRWSRLHAEKMAVTLNLGGLHGDEDVGDPVGYQHLRLVQASDVVEMKVFNRGIALLMTEDEKKE